jgi:hypothetical protein
MQQWVLLILELHVTVNRIWNKTWKIKSVAMEMQQCVLYCWTCHCQQYKKYWKDCHRHATGSSFVLSLIYKILHTSSAILQPNTILLEEMSFMSAFCQCQQYETHIGLYVKRPILLPDFKQIWIFLTQKFPNIKFHENPCSGSRVYACRWTNRCDKANRWFSWLYKCVYKHWCQPQHAS